MHIVTHGASEAVFLEIFGLTNTKYINKSYKPHKTIVNLYGTF